LKYVNSTLWHRSLFFKKKVISSLVGFTDVYFGRDLDDLRSTSGYVFLSGGTSISGCSKKQNSVSLSTTEAEYKVAALAAWESIWLQRLANDLHHPITKPTTLFGDNHRGSQAHLSNISCKNLEYWDQALLY